MKNDARIFTKKKLKPISLWIADRDQDLLRIAASREGVSQSEFLRRSIRDRAEKVLLIAAQ
jgi:uncharacterized protein (DUF1778 family)